MSPNGGRAEPLLAFPGWKHLGEALLLSVAYSAWFAAIYVPADYVTGLRSQRVRIHFDAELKIPFVPATVVLYMSIYPLFWLGPFVLRRSRQLRALVASMGLVTLCGGIGFLLIPSEAAYVVPPVPSPWTELYAWADRLNLRYNMVPSLHVALAILCVDIFSRRASLVGWTLLWTWGVAIAASTVLTYFHHVIDVVAGMALALLVSRFVYPRWASAGRERPPPTACDAAGSR